MARLPIVDFQNQRDPKGYRLEYSSWYGAREPVILRNGPVDRPWEETLIDCPRLRGSELQYFVKTAKDAKGALEFVRDFGPLTAQGHSEHGEPVSTYTFMARSICGLLKMAEAGEWSEAALHTLDMTAGARIRASVAWDPVARALCWHFRVDSLQDALWAQLLQKLAGGDPLRRCQQCGDWFEAGRGAGRRAGAKFCCDAHRDRFNSLKRSRRV
jgi:hypothetical protein